VKSVVKTKTPWYAGGLHFECVRCGRCCSGPDEGYIWVTKREIKLIADFLKISPEQCRRKFLKRIGHRTTIIEHHSTKDCIFLQESNSRKKCIIYPVRPSQCRIWPFWSSNLKSPAAWNQTAKKCPGINRGRFYSLDDIKKVKARKKWWQNKTSGD